MSVEPFNRLVKLAARAFYDDITIKTDNRAKTDRSDNRGIAVVVLDALTALQWVREDHLAKDLKLKPKQLSRTLRFLEEEKLVARDYRKETPKDAKIRIHTHSYCCLDYAQTYDVVRYRINRMKKKFKDQLDHNNRVEEYMCPNCGKRYSALDALRLVSLEDEYFHCENCNGELVAESDKLAAQQGGNGKLKDVLQKMAAQLKPLMEQLGKVKDLPVPELSTLQAGVARELGFGGTTMPFFGDTKVEVTFSGLEGKEGDVKCETGSASLKVLPPWMIKQGMNLTKEQRGEIKQDLANGGVSDDMSRNEHDEKKNIQVYHDEYAKAYYAALLKRQQELEEAAKTQQGLSNTRVSAGPSVMSVDRQVGMKSKLEEDEGDDVEWEEAPIESNTRKSYKVGDLSIEANNDDVPGEEEDDIDWEEA